MYENNRDGIAELFPPGPALRSLDLHMEDSHQRGCPRQCQVRSGVPVACAVPALSLAGD